MSGTSSKKAIGRIGEIVIDVRDLEASGRFWSEVLGAAIRSADEQYLALDSQPGSPALILQKVTEGKQGKNRVHIDIRVKDVEAALNQVEALGGGKVRVVVDPTERFIVVADPDGNEFCLVEEGS
jgi:predicted enzyme related to lactoylglutathione lyase